MRLEVFRNNARYETTLLNYAADAGACTWTVPSDIELHDADYFQAKLTIVDGAVQTTILEERYSPPFQVVRPGNNSGLTDVTVNSRHVSITLIDDSHAQLRAAAVERRSEFADHLNRAAGRAVVVAGRAAAAGRWSG